MYGVHCKHSSSIQPLISNNNLVLLGYGSMCTGTLDHIARYPSKTSNNNKTLIVDLLYDFIYSCFSYLLVDIPYIVPSYWYSSLSHLAVAIYCLYVLIPWICIFRFWGLERSGAIHRGPGLFQWAGWSDLVPSCQTLPFGSRVSISYVSILCICLYIVLLDLDMINNTCKVYYFIIICITLYLYLVSWPMNTPRFVLYSVSLLYFYA